MSLLDALIWGSRPKPSEGFSRTSSPSSPTSPPDPELARLLGMPLDRFEQEGCPLEVRVRWLQVSLWFVPGLADIEALALEGVPRGRIWTAAELLDLLTIPGLTPEQVRTIAHAKLEFGGEMVEVRPRRETSRRCDEEAAR